MGNVLTYSDLTRTSDQKNPSSTVTLLGVHLEAFCPKSVPAKLSQMQTTFTALKRAVQSNGERDTGSNTCA